MAADDRLERIRHRAHDLWEKAGRPHGRDVEHWAQAEREVSAEDGATGTTKRPTPRAVRNARAAREAGSVGSGAGSSEAFGGQGSGSTTNIPGGGFPESAQTLGNVAGIHGAGVGGPGAPATSPIAESGVKGAGARSRRATGAKAPKAGEAAAKRTRKRS